MFYIPHCHFDTLNTLILSCIHFLITTQGKFFPLLLFLYLYHYRIAKSRVEKDFSVIFLGANLNFEF